MIKLTDEQYHELELLLGHDPKNDGEWSLVPSTDPYMYAINSLGDCVVRLSSLVKGKGLTQYPIRMQLYEDPGHYLLCSINNKPYKVHRLMAEVWLSNFDSELTVNHIDGNKHNNRIENLELVSSWDNVRHYHTSEALKEKRSNDFKHHSEVLRGRIHITDGKSDRMIYLSDGIPEGWWRGRPNNENKCLSDSYFKSKQKLITNGTESKFISKDSEVPEGWWPGGSTLSNENKRLIMHNLMIGRIFITRDRINKRIHRDEVEKYIAEGWTVGMYNKQTGTIQRTSVM